MESNDNIYVWIIIYTYIENQKNYYIKDGIKIPKNIKYFNVSTNNEYTQKLLDRIIYKGNKMIFVCGDTHGGEAQDLEKLNNKNFKNQYLKNVYFKFSTTPFNNRLKNNFNNRTIKFYKNGYCDVFLDKKDKVIVLGDFGLIWSLPNQKYYKQELFYLKQLTQKPYQLLFLDGNHENHDLLNKLKEKDYCGGKVGIAYSDKNGEILHLKRGEVYIFDNKKYFVLGGAKSHSYLEEKDGVNWWNKEDLQLKDVKNSLKNLKKHNFEVDYVLTHNCPSFVGLELYNQLEKPKEPNNFYEEGEYNRKLNKLNKYLFKVNDNHSKFFDKLINKYNLKFKEWHFGHYHEDKKIFDKFFVHYNNIVYLN